MRWRDMFNTYSFITGQLISSGGTVLVGGSSSGTSYFNNGGGPVVDHANLPIDFTATSAYPLHTSHTHHSHLSLTRHKHISARMLNYFVVVFCFVFFF